MAASMAEWLVEKMADLKVVEKVVEMVDKMVS